MDRVARGGQSWGRWKSGSHLLTVPLTLSQPRSTAPLPMLGPLGSLCLIKASFYLVSREPRPSRLAPEETWKSKRVTGHQVSESSGWS